MKYRFVAKTVALLILGLPLLSSAQGDIHFGRTEVHPAVKVGYSYDDNIYLSGDDVAKVSSGIVTVSPSLQLRNEGKRRTFTLDYNLQHLNYQKKDAQDRTSQTLSLTFDNEFSNGLMLTLRDTYQKTDDPASSEVTTKNERTQHYFFAEVGSKVYDRLSFHVNYGGTVHDYKEFALRNQDRSEYTTGGRVEVRLLPKTSFFLDYSRTDIEYDTVVSGDVRDSRSERFHIGMKGDVTSKLTLYASLGYQNTEYEQAGKKDYSSVTTTISVNHVMTAYTDLAVTLLRTFRESFYTDGINTYNLFVESRVIGTINYKITQKMNSNLTAFYGINDYPASAAGRDRKDKLYGFGLGLDYNIRDWLAVGAGYRYQERDSDANDGVSEDYKNNQYSAFIKASF